ncbi:MAG: hypothetical protein IID16_02995 [Candidatus Marinimicrobia bacterium]|nr:hypothetical protein [Candidatus Neomarinimicrobiota bacterium]
MKRSLCLVLSWSVFVFSFPVKVQAEGRINLVAESAIEMGKLLSVSNVETGPIGRMGESYTLDVRMFVLEMTAMLGRFAPRDAEQVAKETSAMPQNPANIFISVSSDNAILSIDFTLPEAASSGTVKLTFTENGTALDANDPHVLTFAVAFESAGQHAATLNGADLSSDVNVSSASSDPSDALVDGALYDVKIEFQDAAGNPVASVTNTSFTYDTAVPTISSTAPATGSTVNTTRVSYTLSEAVASGTITWTRTGGSADGGSPHVQALSDTELNSGAHTNITLTNNPTLVDGTIYTVAFDATDAAGNAATTISNTNVTFTETQAPTLASPAASSLDNATLDIDFTLPEAASSATVKLIFTENGTALDANDPHILTFAAAFETAGQHTATLTGSDLSANANVASVSSDPSDALVDGAIYDVKIEYQDAAGNPVASVTNTSFTYDTTVPTISSTAPATGSTVNTTQVSYTLSETVASGTITWTRTGAADGGSPYVQALSDTELNSWAHTNITLTNNPTLVDGTIYTVTFDATDAAGNAATTISNTNVTFTETQAPTLASLAARLMERFNSLILQKKKSKELLWVGVGVLIVGGAAVAVALDRGEESPPQIVTPPMFPEVP